MKRFRFRLESVLALRSLAERSGRERFGAAQQRLAAALAALRAAEARRLGLAEALAASREGASFRPAEQAAGLAALRDAERDIQEAARRHAEAAAAAAKAREEWLAARRRLQVVEKLEERARRAHREAAEKAEQALLDELASLAAARSTPDPA